AGQRGKHGYVGIAPLAGIELSLSRKREEYVRTQARHPLEDVESLLLRESSDEERNRYAERQCEAIARRFHTGFGTRGREYGGIDAVEDHRGRPHPADLGEMPPRDLADEHHAVGEAKNGCSNEVVGKPHQRAQDDAAVRNESDVL